MYHIYKGYHLDLSKVACIYTGKRDNGEEVLIDVKITLVGCLNPSISFELSDNDIESRKVQELVEAFETSANIDFQFEE